MNVNNDQTTQKQKPKKQKKRRRWMLLSFFLLTLFLLSFSATSFILMNSYRLTFADESLATLRQELSLLKNEIAKKNSEIEALKLQLANIEGESSFANKLQNEISKE